MAAEHSTGRYETVPTVAIPMTNVGLYALLNADLLSPIYSHLPPDVVVHRTHGTATDVLQSVSPVHRRSFLYPRHEQTASNGRYFVYQGDCYSAITTKGNEFSNIHAELTTLNEGFRIYGLQDGLALQRVVNASKLMRNNGIETEVILRIRQPEKFLLPDGREVDQIGIKEFLIAHVREYAVHHFEPNELTVIEQAYGTLEDRLDKVLKPMQFFITDRAHQVPERLIDLTYPQTEKQQREMFGQIFDFLNFSNSIKLEQGKLSGPVRTWSSERSEDIGEYVVSELPKKAAKNIARIHNSGLVHKFLTTHNISAVGSIVDLDSVEGQPLGIEYLDPESGEIKSDPPITEKAIQKDISQALTSIGETIAQLQESFQNSGLTTLSPTAKEEAQWAFITEYLSERFGITATSPVYTHLTETQQMLSSRFPEIRLEFNTILTGIVAKETHFAYTYTLDFPRTLSNFLEEEREYYKQRIPQLEAAFGSSEYVEDQLFEEIYYEPLQNRLRAFLGSRVREDFMASSHEWVQQVSKTLGTEQLEAVIQLFIDTSVGKAYSAIFDSREKRTRLKESAEKAMREICANAK